jgi:hypothetical protein
MTYRAHFDAAIAIEETPEALFPSPLSGLWEIFVSFRGFPAVTPGYRPSALRAFLVLQATAFMQSPAALKCASMQRRWRAISILSLLLALAALVAAPAATAADYVLLVAGMGGDPKFTQEFHQQLVGLEQQLTTAGYAPARMRRLEGDDARLDRLAAAFRDYASQLKPKDTLLIVLRGHGQSDYREAKFNLPGPDLEASLMRQWLAALPTADVRLLLDFPCSGAFAQALAAPGRVILSSCNGPDQIYGGTMTRLLLAGLRNGAIDLNRDGRVSFREAFDYLSKAVEGDYQARSLLQTENPALEDNGDGRLTTTQKGMDQGDGKLAAVTWLIPAPARPDPTPAPARLPGKVLRLPGRRG